MHNIAVAPVAPIADGFTARTGVGCQPGDVGREGAIAQHWGEIRNDNEDAFEVRLRAEVRKTARLRARARGKRGQVKLERTWKMTVTVQPAPRARWLRQPKFKPTQISQELEFVAGDDSEALLEVTMHHRIANIRATAWECSGASRLAVPCGDKAQTP